MLSWASFPFRAFPLPALNLVASPVGCAPPGPSARFRKTAGRDRSPLTPFGAHAASRVNTLGLRVLRHGEIGLTLSGLPALLGFPTSDVSRRCGFGAALDYRFSSGETSRRRVACTRLRAVPSTSGVAPVRRQDLWCLAG